MIIDISRYDVNKTYVQRYWNDMEKKDLQEAIGHLSGMTMVPCVAIAYWIGEIEGYTPEIMGAIQGFKDFYGYTEIEGKAPDAP